MACRGTEATIFGVSHYDDELTQKLSEKSPESVDHVYHESIKKTRANVLDSIIWRPLQLVILLFNHVKAKADVSPSGARTECEKAALSLADEHDAEFHHIGMSRKERTAGVCRVSTVSEWLTILASLPILYCSITTFGMGGLFWASVFLAVFIFVQVWWWNRIEYPIREYHMSNQVLNNQPADGETAVVVVGNDHRESVTNKLEAFHTTTKDVTP